MGSNERSRRLDVPFDTFGQRWPTSGGEIGQNCRKSVFSKLVLVRATTFEQEVIDLVIGSNERARHVIVPFDIFGQIWPISGREIGQNCPKSGYSKLVRTTTFKRKVIDTWL